MLKKIKYNLMKLYGKIKYALLVLKYKTFPTWFKKHKDNWFFTTLEKANWFPWYGKRVVYVKRDPSKLSATQQDVKEAIKAKDYAKALEIVNGLPETTQTVMLKQVIEAKLK